MNYYSQGEQQQAPCGNAQQNFSVFLAMTSYGLLTIMAVAAIVSHNAEQAAQAESRIVYCVPAPAEETP